MFILFRSSIVLSPNNNTRSSAAANAHKRNYDLFIKPPPPTIKTAEYVKTREQAEIPYWVMSSNP